MIDMGELNHKCLGCFRLLCPFGIDLSWRPGGSVTKVVVQLCARCRCYHVKVQGLILIQAKSNMWEI